MVKHEVTNLNSFKIVRTKTNQDWKLLRFHVSRTQLLKGINIFYQEHISAIPAGVNTVGYSPPLLEAGGYIYTYGGLSRSIFCLQRSFTIPAGVNTATPQEAGCICRNILKGTVVRDFQSQFFSWMSPPPPLPPMDVGVIPYMFFVFSFTFSEK